MQNHHPRTLFNTLERGLATVYQRHHDIAISSLRPFLNDNMVTIMDTVIDHRIALYLEHETGAGGAQEGGNLDVFVPVYGLDGTVTAADEEEPAR